MLSPPGDVAEHSTSLHTRCPVGSRHQPGLSKETDQSSVRRVPRPSPYVACSEPRREPCTRLTETDDRFGRNPSGTSSCCTNHAALDHLQSMLRSTNPLVKGVDHLEQRRPLRDVSVVSAAGLPEQVFVRPRLSRLSLVSHSGEFSRIQARACLATGSLTRRRMTAMSYRGRRG